MSQHDNTVWDVQMGVMESGGSPHSPSATGSSSGKGKNLTATYRWIAALPSCLRSSNGYANEVEVEQKTLWLSDQKEQLAGAMHQQASLMHQPL